MVNSAGPISELFTVNRSTLEGDTKDSFDSSHEMDVSSFVKQKQFEKAKKFGEALSDGNLRNKFYGMMVVKILESDECIKSALVFAKLLPRIGGNLMSPLSAEACLKSILKKMEPNSAAFKGEINEINKIMEEIRKSSSYYD